MSKNGIVVLMLALLIVGIGALGWVLTRPQDGGGAGGGQAPTVADEKPVDPGALRGGKPGAVTAEVRILATQEPAEGIEVQVTGAGKPVYAETNSLGKFIAHAPSGVELTVKVIAPEPYATLLFKGITLEPDKSLSLGTLYLEKAFLVKGEVIDHQGNRVAGAAVSAYRPTVMEANLNPIDLITSMGKKHTPLEETTTGEDGSFVLSSLSPGSYRLEAKAEGFCTGFLPGAIVSPESTDHLFRIVVSPGLKLTGTVKTTSGQPVEGALVTTLRVGSRSFEELDFQPVQISTDEQGEFSFANLRPGEAGLMVSAENYPLTIVDRVDIGSGKPVDVVLGGSASMEGTVKNGDGEALEGADVMVAVGRQGGAFGRVLTDEQGHYRLENLPAGRIQFAMVRKTGYPSWPSGSGMLGRRQGFGELKDGETSHKDFELVKGAIITGMVTDSSTGRPVPGAEVTLRSIGGGFGFGSGGSSITGEDGAFVLEGAGEGMHLLTVKASGFAQAGLNQQAMGSMFGRMGGENEPDPDGPMVKVTAEQTEVRKNISVVPGATIRGRVVDRNNNPVGGAKVTVNAGGNDMGMFTRMMGLSPTSVLTNAEGEFQIDGAPPAEKTTLLARAEGFVDGSSEELRVTTGSEVTGVTIMLGTGGTLQGTVYGADGNPLSGASVRVINWTPNQGRQDFVPTWQLQRAEAKLSGDDGSFTVDGIKPGPILVGIDAPGHLMRVEKNLVAAEGEVSGGHSFRLDRGMVISGRVVDEDGMPVACENIWINQQRQERNTIPQPTNSNTSSSADGNFTLDRLPPGTYDIRARADGYAPEVREGVAAGTTGVLITLQKGRKIAGVVLLPDGSPAPNVWVSVQGEGGNNQSDQTDEDGRFEVKNLKAGTCTVSARIQSWRGGPMGLNEKRPNIRDTTVTGVAAGTETVQIRLLRGYAIRGFIRDAAGSPIPGARVSAAPVDKSGSFDDSRPRGNGVSLEDGSFEIMGLDDGTYQLSAWLQGYQVEKSTTAVAGATGVEVVMKAE